MAWRDVPVSLWLRAVTIAAAPLTLAFIVLAALGLLAPGDAALTWLGLSLVSAAAIHWLPGDLLRTRNRLEQLARGEASATVAARTRIERELSQAIQRLECESGERAAQLTSDLDGMERALDALPGPVLLLNEAHNVVRANRASR